MPVYLTIGSSQLIRKISEYLLHAGYLAWDKYPDISFRQIHGYLLLKDLKISALGRYWDICIRQLFRYLLKEGTSASTLSSYSDICFCQMTGYLLCTWIPALSKYPDIYFGEILRYKLMYGRCQYLLNAETQVSALGSYPGICFWQINIPAFAKWPDICLMTTLGRHRFLTLLR